MAGRRLIAAALLLVSAVALGGLLAALDARAATAPATSVYRLRADSRACPSPVCGGYWASRVNRSLTACLDGSTSSSCYVAALDLSPLSAGARARAEAALRLPTTFVTGSFGHFRNEDFPDLARLVVSRVWTATGPSRATATVYRVVDTGIRCIRAPCFSFRAAAVNRSGSSSLSGIDLSQVGASPAELGRARAALATGGALASGAIRPESKDGGRVLVATQVWIPA